ncbi:MAG TPA: alpha/beta fold hydrolase [Burkholderiales bacterium]|nr:alpha/beta fold hydrolase [Burkholderiales bacterium]
MEIVELRAADGFELSAALFRPAAPNRRAVQIHAAAGVRQEYYADFARFLAGRGFHVLTFDYRGVGRSAPRHVRDIEARMQDWALLDAPAALEFVAGEIKPSRHLVVGHSFGGQSVAVMPGNDRVHALLAVASQSVYYGHWSGTRKLGLWMLTRVLLPAATHAAGYFPGGRLPEGEDLPAGVALEWARWCQHPRYLVGALGLEDRAAAFRAPLRLLSMADDVIYAPRAAAQGLLDLYPNARKEHLWIEPREVGLERIGHFGFFRERSRAALWEGAAAWLARV